MDLENKVDDKSQVIIAATLLGVLCLFVIPNEAPNIINAIIAGLFGVAVGKSMK